jgi:hypothetical protein
LNRFFGRWNDKINFISSFRLFPERTYYETTKTDLTVGKFGEDYVNQVILWETRKAKQYKELIKIMKNLSLLEEIKSRRLEGGRFELTVKVNESSVPASLSDVGFGISQFLPILVADLQLGEGSTLFVAQPEIHLHPSVQAEFGDYMVSQVKQADKNYIIETHREYLLNRIRLAIVKGEIPGEDVKVYYLHNDGEDVHTHKLEFTTDGQILNAPEDFFKTYMMDVMNIAVNADIKEFQRQHFTKKVVKNLRSNKDDHDHIPVVLLPDRKYALSLDDDFVYDLVHFPGFKARAEKRPENLPYFFALNLLKITGRKAKMLNKIKAIHMPGESKSSGELIFPN